MILKSLNNQIIKKNIDQSEDILAQVNKTVENELISNKTNLRKTKNLPGLQGWLASENLSLKSITLK